jgi:hypothetical protein
MTRVSENIFIIYRNQKEKCYLFMFSHARAGISKCWQINLPLPIPKSYYTVAKRGHFQWRYTKAVLHKFQFPFSLIITYPLFRTALFLAPTRRGASLFPFCIAVCGNRCSASEWSSWVLVTDWLKCWPAFLLLCVLTSLLLFRPPATLAHAVTLLFFFSSYWIRILAGTSTVRIVLSWFSSCLSTQFRG